MLVHYTNEAKCRLIIPDDLEPVEKATFTLQDAETLMPSVRERLKTGFVSTALDLVLEKMDDGMKAAEFDNIRAAIKDANRHIDDESVPMSVFLTFLTGTLPVRNHPALLTEIATMRHLLRKRAVREKGEKAAAEIMVGL